jgi:hypothetical protein
MFAKGKEREREREREKERERSMGQLLGRRMLTEQGDKRSNCKCMCEEKGALTSAKRKLKVTLLIAFKAFKTSTIEPRFC